MPVRQKNIYIKFYIEKLTKFILNSAYLIEIKKLI
jgi:hypothetical protein